MEEHGGRPLLVCARPPPPGFDRTILCSLAVRPYHIVWQVKEILDQNKAERHIRGGIATRKKYKGT